MLDNFEILTRSGVVLWSRSYSPTSSDVINSLIKDVFIEDRGVRAGAAVGEDSSASNNPPYKKDQYVLRWTTVKGLGLIFVAVYNSLLHLTWIEKLLDNVRIIFADLYKDQLKKPNTTIVECAFDNYFDQQLRELEPSGEQSTAALANTPRLSYNESPGAELTTTEPSLSKDPHVKALLSPQDVDSSTRATSRPSSPDSSHLLSAAKSGPAGRVSRRARKLARDSAPASSGDESNASAQKSKKQRSKNMRKWDADGLAADEDDDVVLDYSSTGPAVNGAQNGEAVASTNPEVVPQDSWGKRTGKGEFVLKDLDEEVHSILSSADAEKADAQSQSGLIGSSFGAISGLFKNVVGGKTITKQDLEKPLSAMQEHLVKKNVAPEAATRLCVSVEQSLVGYKTGNFQNVQTTIREAMNSSLRNILTPTTSLDLLHSIALVNNPPSSTSPRPYVMSIVGVNGVGKSTNLSKLAYFLLQNGHRVLIAACDTFRSGAVEQLRVHARNLAELTARLDNGAAVSLYEKGYGKDAANIARDAVSFGAENNFTVVLIDTAGRRHNDTRLMSSLEKFAKFAQPDKILMVGEALVGTDSVAQAYNFDHAFGPGRKLDGFIISKCDTVGDMVGTLVSMVHSTGVPVLFLGTGQHYSDLRTLNVDWAVRLLMV